MNKVVHFEIPSDNQDRAKQFYSSVFNWEVPDMPGEHPYTFAITCPVDENFMYKESGAINGGIFKREAPITNPVITIDVPSIEEHAKKIEAAGGTMVVEKGEVPGMGYYAYFKNTEGNLMGLWENLPAK